MKLDFTTDRLPLNFIALGYMLLAISIWRIIVSDFLGIPFLIVSCLLIFYKSGIIIDTDNKMLKRYNGIFMLKQGKWEDINQITALQIINTIETQTMSVLSISRKETTNIYKLIAMMPDKNIELLSGDKDDIIYKSNKIASALQTSLIQKFT